MADLTNMPAVSLDPAVLGAFGQNWIANGGRFTDKKHQGFNSAEALGDHIDQTVAGALATMLGGIPIHKASGKKKTKLYPPEPDCVETAPVTIVGGIRKQDYDVAYRPDGVRFAFDSKTLNEAKSIGKNWQNMVNDLATEAATVHTRFPLAVVGFMVLLPEPALGGQLESLTWRLAGLGARTDEFGPTHVAEAMCMAVWDPTTGLISPTIPDPNEHPTIRIENFSPQIEETYRTRYAGALPH
jgi:hypothetical protein